MIEYEQRDLILHSIGFASYSDYLNSRLWARIRNRVFKRRKSCACCGEPANEVHHKDYRLETLKGENLSGLSPLCSACHDIAEFEIDGSKATLKAANQKIDMLSSLERIPAPRSNPRRTSEPEDDRDMVRVHVHFGERLSKRKMVLAGIPDELMPSPEIETKRLPIPRGMRMLMPEVKRK